MRHEFNNNNLISRVHNIIIYVINTKYDYIKIGYRVIVYILYFV